MAVMHQTRSGTISQPTPYSQMVLGDRPARYWRLNESSGVVIADAADPPNLVTNPDGRTNLTGYTGASGGALAQVTDDIRGASIAVTRGIVDNSTQAVYDPVYSAAPGDVFTLRASFRPFSLTGGGAWVSVVMYANFLDSVGGTLLNSAAASVSSPANGVWVDLFGTSAAAPAGTVAVKILLVANNDSIATANEWRFRGVAMFKSGGTGIATIDPRLTLVDGASGALGANSAILTDPTSKALYLGNPWDTYAWGDVPLTLANHTTTPGSMSMEIWVKTPTTPSGTLYFFGFGDPASTQSLLDLYMSLTGYIGIQMRTITGANYSSLVHAVNYADGNWHHVVYTFAFIGPTNGNRNLYIDGNLVVGPVNSNVVANPINTTRVVVGGLPRVSPIAQSGLANGTVDEAAIYPYALTANQVAAHYRAATNQ